jgi:hypothetical protein
MVMLSEEAHGSLVRFFAVHCACAHFHATGAPQD